MNTAKLGRRRVRSFFTMGFAAVLAVSAMVMGGGCSAPEAINDDRVPLATEADAGALTVTGGTAGVDYEFRDVDYKRAAHTGANTVGNAATPMLVILKDTPLTITSEGKVAATGIRIEKGVDAHLTFDNVRIAADVPCDIVTNAAKPGTSDTTLAGNPTKLHLTLADGSENELLANAGAHAPGLRCGEGSELYIDDSVPNRDVNGNAITPEGGYIPAGTTYRGQDGNQYTAGTKAGDNSLSNLESRNPGKLKVVAGYRAAAIGSGSWENAGKMTFDGGVFEVRPWTKTGTNRPSSTTSGVGTDWDYGDGAGIGGGYAGCGTEMYFNGGTFAVYGSYHGAAIGGGMYSYSTTTPGDWPQRSYPFADAIRSKLVGVADSSKDARGRTTPGDITINGGFIRAIGGLHGNAFGQACGSWAKDCTILVTGGTLLPDSYGSLKMIGGKEGHVVVTGGSVNCTADKFEGIGDTAWGSTDYSDNDNKVFMTTINLSADGWTNNTITNFDLAIGGNEYNYGAPSKFDNGKLYLWLPKTAVGKEVRVSLTGERVDADGKVTQETPADLYIPSASADGSSKLKRYINFELPKTWREENWYKDYNGLPFPIYDFATQPAIETSENPPKLLDTNTGVAYKYQYCDEKGSTVGEEIVVDASHPMPTDASKFTITMTSEQYSKQPGFMESYWGHRAYGDAEIRKVPSRIPTLKARWYDAAGNLIEDEGHKAKATDKLLITAQVTSGKNTATTCKAPVGTLELLVDGQVVEKFRTDKLGGTAAAGKMEVLKDGDGREYVQFTYEATAADKDYLLPNFKNDNKHVVTMNFIADKNYLDTRADEDPEAPKANVTVEPVDPDPAVKPGADVVVTPPTSPDPGDPGNPGGGTGGSGPTLSDDGTAYEKGFGLTYTFKKLPEGQTSNKLTFEITSPSSGAFDVADPSNPIVAENVKVTQKVDADGKPVKDGAGNFVYEVSVDVKSVGETKLELTQKPNGAFYGTNFTIDLTVKPNPTIAPVPVLTKTAVNLTHPDGAVQAGDRIKYTIEAKNTAAGSIWWFPKISDKLPDSVTLDPSTLHLISTSEGIDKMLSTGEYTFEKGVLKVGAGLLSQVYGPQSAVLEFECVVRDVVGSRDVPDSLKSVANTAEATGYKDVDVPEGTEPVDPDDPTVPDADKPSATPVNPNPSDPAEPAYPEVLPKDPRLPDMTIVKQAQNLNRVTGQSQAGDVVQYSITLSNGTPGSCWYRAAFLDALPRGVVFEPDSATLVTPTGARLELSDAVYDAASNRLGVAVGDLYGGEKAVLTFRAKVTEAAVGQDLGNIAHAVGTLPSEEGKKKPGDGGPGDGGPGDGGTGGPSDGSGDGGPGDGTGGLPGDPSDPSGPGGTAGIPADPGTPYLPDDDTLLEILTEGGLPVDPAHPEGPRSVPQNPEKAYPTPDDKPQDPASSENADENDKGLLSQSSATGDKDDEGDGFATFLRLPQTGDALPLAALAIFAAGSLVVLLVAGARRRKARESEQPRE